MDYKEVYTHNAFECEVRFGFNKPTKRKYLFKHLVLDCGIVDSRNPIISSFSQAEASIIKWYNSGRWMKICGNDKDREEWSRYLNDTTAFDEIEITKMEKTWYYFLQTPQDYMDRLDVFWIQVNSNLRIWVESVKRPIINKERILVAIPSKEKNQYGCYMLTDDMKEQAVSFVRDYYTYALNMENLKAEIKLCVDRSDKECVVCADNH
jgi:hypothetical protein